MTILDIRRGMGRGFNYLIIPLCFALFISFKPLANRECGAFDMSDDANHTFVHMMAVKEAVSGGQMPLMNLYHNFGTPLIGDVLTYPFSPLALTYWILPFDRAMLVNRALAAALTVLCLTLYFRRRLGRFLSSACALGVVLAPGFLWCLAHHHYQLTLMWFSLAMMWQEDWNQYRRGADFIRLCLLFIIAFLSVSMNLMAIMVLMLVLNQIFLVKGRPDARSWLFICTVMSGLLFIAPDVLSLIAAGARGVRAGAHYSLVGVGEVLAHVNWLCVVLGAAGAWRMRAACVDAWRIFLLGPALMAAVTLAIRSPVIWDALPFFHSTDLTRFYWMAGVFVMLGAGVFLQDWPWHRGWRIGAIMVFLVAIGLTGYVDAQKILGYADLKTCRPAGMHYFSDRGTDVFPRYFARLLEPYSRVAADRISSDGQDIRIQRDHVFGSSGRSAVMVDGAFREYLRREGLIEIEAPLGTYHFKAPWDARKLAALGIRYVMSPVPDPAAAANGWELLGYAQEILYVYENPLPTGLVYLKDAAGELEPIASQRLFMRGSVIAVSLPEITRSLEFVATFIHVPGWQARVDGVSREIISGPDRLMRVLLRRGDQRIEMRYQPFAWYHFAAGILAALAVAGLGWCFLRRDSFKYQRIV